MPNTSLFELCKKLQELYSEMASNAIKQRWSELPSQQEEANLLVAILQTLSWDFISKDQRTAIAGLIKKILEDQKAIQLEVRDWQSDIAPLLASFDARPPRK